MKVTNNEIFIPGDVIEDSYANPAVVLHADKAGIPILIMQTTGSDANNRTYPPLFLRRITDDREESAREFAREQWRHGSRW